MPDRFVCDCGYSSESFSENCPMCGAMMMSIDGEADDVDVHKAERYDDAEEDEEVSGVPQRKAA